MSRTSKAKVACQIGALNCLVVVNRIRLVLCCLKFRAEVSKGSTCLLTTFAWRKFADAAS